MFECCNENFRRRLVLNGCTNMKSCIYPKHQYYKGLDKSYAYYPSPSKYINIIKDGKLAI